MIAQITRAYIRHYRDNGQITAYVEWIAQNGTTGRTEGIPSNGHMAALLARAGRDYPEQTYVSQMDMGFICNTIDEARAECDRRNR